MPPTEPPVFNYPQGHPTPGARYRCSICGASPDAGGRCTSKSGEHFMETIRPPKEYRKTRAGSTDTAVHIGGAAA